MIQTPHDEETVSINGCINIQDNGRIIITSFLNRKDTEFTEKYEFVFDLKITPEDYTLTSINKSYCKSLTLTSKYQTEKLFDWFANELKMDLSIETKKQLEKFLDVA